jgi:hypothetical protein
MKVLLFVSLIIGSGVAYSQLSSPGVSPASPSAGATITNTPNTFNFGEGTGFGNTDSGTGNSLENSSFGPTTPIPNVNSQGFGTTTPTPNTMQPGTQFDNNNALNPSVAPVGAQPESNPSIQAEELENDNFERRRPGF